jgi:hypothetical protein
MLEFKLMLEQIIEGNDLERLIPSQEYSEREMIYMEAYNEALKDIYSEFEEHFNEFMSKYHSFSLN